MKKNLFALTLALIMALTLTACGGDTSSTDAPPSQPPASEQTASDAQVADAYAFQTKGSSVRVNANMADVLAAIGEPISYFEAESCAFEGLDKTYTYGGFAITTRPDGDLDFINSILLTDDSVTTAEGIYIGSSKDDVLSAYGDGGEDLGALIAYTKGDCVLNFVLSEDKVISIEYLPTT